MNLCLIGRCYEATVKLCLLLGTWLGWAAARCVQSFTNIAKVMFASLDPLSVHHHQLMVTT